MLKIVMGLKQSVTSEEFDKNAPNTPYIAGERPSKPKNNLRGAVVSSGDHR